MTTDFVQYLQTLTCPTLSLSWCQALLPKYVFFVLHTAGQSVLSAPEHSWPGHTFWPGSYNRLTVIGFLRPTLFHNTYMHSLVMLRNILMQSKQ